MSEIIETSLKPRPRLPRWMKAEMPNGLEYLKVKKLTEEHDLHTICVSGNCPNKGECWSRGTASFMILGDKCTRNCRFCAVENMLPDDVAPAVACSLTISCIFMQCIYGRSNHAKKDPHLQVLDSFFHLVF